MMRAVLMPERNGTPLICEVPEPGEVPGTTRIKVAAAGLMPTDIMRAQGTYRAPQYPYIIGGEGVGFLCDGTRVYFGHAVPSSGAMAEWAIVPDEEIWALPEEMDAAQAIALAISGTGALIPLEEARISKGERVLILGATGPLGQVALQVAKFLGAGTIAAAARTPATLHRLHKRGIADEIVELGMGNDDAALAAAAGPGFDVVLDCVYGPPAEAVMRAMAVGGRMMSIGVGAGPNMTVPLGDLVGRAHYGVGTGHRPAAERRAAFERLLDYAHRGLRVDVSHFPLEQVKESWRAQLGSPGSKIIVNVANQ